MLNYYFGRLDCDRNDNPDPLALYLTHEYFTKFHKKNHVISYRRPTGGVIHIMERCCNRYNNLSGVKKQGKPKDNNFYLISSEESIELFDDCENRGRIFYSKIITCAQEVKYPNRNDVKKLLFENEIEYDNNNSIKTKSLDEENVSNDR